jgi:hypothetical protein
VSKAHELLCDPNRDVENEVNFTILAHPRKLFRLNSRKLLRRLSFDQKMVIRLLCIIHYAPSQGAILESR